MDFIGCTLLTSRCGYMVMMTMTDDHDVGDDGDDNDEDGDDGEVDDDDKKVSVDFIGCTLA